MSWRALADELAKKAAYRGQWQAGSYESGHGGDEDQDDGKQKNTKIAAKTNQQRWHKKGFHFKASPRKLDEGGDYT